VKPLRALAVLALAAAVAAQAGEDAAPVSLHPADALHGRVVLGGSGSRLAAPESRFAVPAVAFDHWRHRAMFTCRVCHVDVGFALAAGETGVSAATNEAGEHCGACHDGKRRHAGRPIFAACAGWPLVDAARGCTRCHVGATAGPGRGYAEFREAMPLDSADYVDWAAAERRGLVAPEDHVEGLSDARPPMRIDRDVTIAAVGTWLENVTFSHRKHAAWTGCELCHPDVFPLTQRGSVRYDMAAVQDGRYCGVCHRNVAFPLDACRRCHSHEARRVLQ
jgi:c(7)-type cytochrome triheme protein